MKTKSWDERAKAAIAQGCTTYSKRSDQFVKGVFPTHILFSNGNSLICNDKKSYIDFIGGLGSTILESENNYCLPSVHEVILAEMVKERFPFIDKIKILKTGSEACQAAVRIARAYQKNSGNWRNGLVIGSGYHGFHSLFISAEAPGTGTFFERYTKAESISEIIDQMQARANTYAAVIVEPVQLEISISLLRKLRKICTQQRTVLIFDEVITGFRTPKYCMANYLGIEPDLICLGKAMANGYPISVIGGKAKFMDTKDYFISSTFAGERLAIYSSIVTMQKLTPKVLSDLWEKGARFQKEFNKITPRLQLIGIPTKMVYQGDDMTKHLFWQEMCLRGFLTGKALHIFVSHTPEILTSFIKNAKECLKLIKNEKVQLKGELSKPVFKRY
jgi:glutamate-1-semialdehyde 2,1-aminomutase